jgi:mono/diheme cytochrome c family protein
MFPRLANNQVVQQTNPTTVIRVILDGAQSVTTPTSVTGPAMPAFHWRMTDQQVADVSTYIRNSWGNTAPAVTVEQVRKMREQLGDRRD